MNKFLSSLDKWVMSIIKNLVGVFMIILTVVVFMQVLIRYVFDLSIGGIEELPVYLMVFSVWLIAAMLARKDDHIKLELIELIIKNKKVLKLIHVLVHILTLASIAVFTYLSFDYVQFGIETGDTVPGLKIPSWWLTSIVLVSGVLITVFYMMHIYRSVKEIAKWK